MIHQSTRSLLHLQIADLYCVTRFEIRISKDIVTVARPIDNYALEVLAEAGSPKDTEYGANGAKGSQDQSRDPVSRLKSRRYGCKKRTDEE